MAPISDAVVVDVFRRVDRLLTPLVDRLRRPPGMPQADRDRWWADRLPFVAAGIAAAPRFLGRLADLLPLQNTVGAAVQSLVVLGVAREHGVDGGAERVSLLARVVLDRDLPVERVEPLLVRAKGTYREEALGRAGQGGTIRRLWRVARLLGRIDDALDARPKGKLRHRALSNLPVVGVLGGYSAEREGLRKAAGRAGEVLDAAVTG
ncbi:MAG TPA: hypothetical protein VK402_06535 [Blastococcus sp.]|nr:hypothetical protein [Blastococcus sp.]